MTIDNSDPHDLLDWDIPNFDPSETRTTCGMTSTTNVMILANALSDTITSSTEMFVNDKPELNNIEDK